MEPSPISASKTPQGIRSAVKPKTVDLASLQPARRTNVFSKPVRKAKKEDLDQTFCVGNSTSNPRIYALYLTVTRDNIN